MTEDEAKRRWCPFANQAAVSAFRIISPAGAGSGAHTCCIASSCMAWRWTSAERDIIETDEQHLFKPSGELNPPFSNTPEGFKVISHDSDHTYFCCRERIVGHEAAKGGCGLAGAPQ